MLKAFAKTSRFYVRTRKPAQMDSQQLENFRTSMLQNLPSFYTYFHSKPSTSDRHHDDRVYEQKLYGKKCNIVGVTPDSQNSATFIKSALTKLNPDLVILGGFNSSKLLSERIATTISQKRIVRNLDCIVQPAKLYCKSMVTPMVTKIIEQDPNHVVHPDSETVFRVDHTHKHIQALNYMTVINQLLDRSFSKISFGMPSDHVVFQEIMINQDISQLRKAFERVIKATRQNKNQYGQPINSFNYYLIHVIGEMRYHAIRQPILHKKELTYTTALLHKSASVYDRVVMFVQNQFVHQISENVHKITVDPKQVYRGGQSDIKEFINLSNSEASAKLRSYLMAEDKNKAIQELLQKLIILNILKNDALQLQLLDNSQNIFKNTAFASLFATISLEQTKQRYRRIKQTYDKQIGEIMKQRIKNITQFKEPQKNFYTLQQMINTQIQRNQDFPVHMIAHNRTTEKQAAIDRYDINKQIESMIRNELTQTERELIDFHRSNQMTRQSIVLYQKLLVQAKLRLKKTDFKLPVHHFGAMSALFKDQMKNSMLSKSKSTKKMLLQNIQKLKQQGMIKEIQSIEEFQKLTNGGTPDISIDMDEQTGQLNLREQGKDNSDEKIKKLLKNDSLFQQMYELTENSKQQQTKDIDQQYDEKHRPYQIKQPTKTNSAQIKKKQNNGAVNTNKSGKKVGRRVK